MIRGISRTHCHSRDPDQRLKPSSSPLDTAVAAARSSARTRSAAKTAISAISAVAAVEYFIITASPSGRAASATAGSGRPPVSTAATASTDSSAAVHSG
ncbi:hypothetical protein SHKM778_27190 [Streptomyces sp. KM77-8]|uniref:Uncharacterized protein n=1 Tax=Streptomyces haneummycinicus TaxID=3074435 RepID=A0AAT9HG51_9ACTN